MQTIYLFLFPGYLVMVFSCYPGILPLLLLFGEAAPHSRQSSVQLLNCPDYASGILGSTSLVNLSRDSCQPK